MYLFSYVSIGDYVIFIYSKIYFFLLKIYRILGMQSHITIIWDYTKYPTIPSLLDIPLRGMGYRILVILYGR